MKKILIIVMSISYFISCSPTTRITSSWREPNVTIDTAQIHKFIVAALLRNQTIRRQVEDNMASYMPDKAVQSYKEFGTDSLQQNDEVYNQKLLAEGFDGIVIMRLANVSREQRYVPGNYPGYYRTWRGYWGYSWSGFYDPGYYTTDKTYDVEVNIYSLKQNQLIWSATTSTINPANNGAFFNDVSKVVYARMQKEGFIK